MKTPFFPATLLIASILCVVAPKMAADAPPALTIITQRNIFDPNRRPPGTQPVRRAPVRLETFTLRGITEATGKSPIAIFEGDGVPASPLAQSIGDLVNGFKITAITRFTVTLLDTQATNAEPVVVAIDRGFQRADGGPWTAASYTLQYDQPRAARQPFSNATRAPFASDFTSDVIIALPNTPPRRTTPARNSNINRRPNRGLLPVPPTNGPADPNVILRLQQQRATE